jgi:predicted amidophosphoribosyltransferase
VPGGCRRTPACWSAHATRRTSAAFVLAPGAARQVAGRHLALVDDVMTTGATLAEATHALLRGGAASVQCWVVARTPLQAEGG